jgi:hypothetical protein
LDELFVMAASSDMLNTIFAQEDCLVPRIGEIMAERLFDKTFREFVSSQIEAFFKSDCLVDIVLFSFDFAMKLSSDSKIATPAAVVTHVALKDFVVGCKVRLSPSYESCSDAKGGPLQLPDIGTLVEDDKSSKPFQVEFQGKKWWYDREALLVADEKSVSSSSGASSHEHSMASKNVIMEWSLSLFTAMFSAFLSRSFQSNESAFNPSACKTDLDSQMQRLLQCGRAELVEHVKFCYDCALLSFCVEHGCFSDASLYNVICEWFKEQPQFAKVCMFAQQAIANRVQTDSVQTDSIQKLLSEFAAMLFTIMNDFSKQTHSQFDSEWEECQRLSKISSYFQDQMTFFDESSVFFQPFGTTSIFCEHPVFLRGSLFPIHAELSISRFSMFQDSSKLNIINWFPVDDSFNMFSDEGGRNIVIEFKNVEGKSCEVVFSPQSEDLSNWLESFQKLQASRKVLDHGIHSTWECLRQTFKFPLELNCADVLFDICCHYVSFLLISGVSVPVIRSAIRTACKWIPQNGKFLIQTMFNWFQILESKQLMTPSDILIDLDGIKKSISQEFVFSDTKQETLRVCLPETPFSSSKASKLFYEIEILELSPSSSLSCGWSAEYSDGSPLLWFADGIRQRSSFPLFNRAGCLMKVGKDSSLLYCSRRFGTGSGEQCGPNRGPQCADCKAHTASKRFELLKWNQGDVIGIAVDIEKQKFHVSVNSSTFDDFTLFCDGLNAPDCSKSLVPTITGKSAKIRINAGASAFRFLNLEFTPIFWSLGSHALLQICSKLFSEVFIEELARVCILDWTPSPGFCEIILRIIYDSGTERFFTKHIQRSLLYDITRFGTENSVISCGTSLFRAVFESDDHFEHFKFHTFRKTSFKLLQKQLLPDDLRCSTFQFNVLFSRAEYCVSLLKSILGSLRTENESKIHVNVIFCMINSLDLDPAQTEIRSGTIVRI